MGVPQPCPGIVWEPIWKQAHMQLVKEHSATVVPARWATVDWSWPKEWNYCAWANLHLKKKEKKCRWGMNGWTFSPKSSQARKQSPPLSPQPDTSWWCCQSFNSSKLVHPDYQLQNAQKSCAPSQVSGKTASYAPQAGLFLGCLKHTADWQVSSSSLAKYFIKNSINI